MILAGHGDRWGCLAVACLCCVACLCYAAAGDALGAPASPADADSKVQAAGARPTDATPPAAADPPPSPPAAAAPPPPAAAAPSPSPAVGPPPAAAPAQQEKLESAPAAEKGTPRHSFTTTVRAERAPPRPAERSASDFAITRDVIAAAPRQEGAEVLRTAPGLYIARSEGLAVGHRYMLRGFDADHGQDLELRVAGLPINLPSHIHGQGYADLGFLIAETVDELRVSEGVYDPRQGDFAVAGSIDVQLGVRQRGWQARSQYGAFNTFRQLLLWAPEGQDRGTFAAVQYGRTDGFGQNRRGQTGSAVVQAIFGSGAWRYRLNGIFYGARADHAGVVRTDDVSAGRVGFLDAYPFPTARAQNALAVRVLLGFTAEYRGERGDNADLGVWLGFDNLRLQENFTGFLQRSRTLANTAGRGDLIEQQNRTFSVGLSARYRSRTYRPATWAMGTVEFGLSGRVDLIEQAQNLLDAAVRNQTWDRRVDASITGADMGLWTDLDWRMTRYLQLRLGMRADVLHYDVNDRLGNFAPLVRPQDSYIVGFRRSAFGVAYGPRASVDVKPLSWLSIRAAYGEGYRSPQARTLEDGEGAPFSKVRSVDFGARIRLRQRYQITATGYYTHLSDDVAFDAEEGRLERIGETQRLGLTVHAEGRPLDWIVGAFSLTYVDAELREPPPATAEEPQPPYQPGQNLPYVPPLVLRLDLGVNPTLVKKLWRAPLALRAGVGFSYLSPRPLPYGAFADPVPLLDASVGLRWGLLDVGLDLFNLLDRRYAAIEYNFPSSWSPDEARSRTPARHFAAGAPLTWMLTAGVSL